MATELFTAEVFEDLTNTDPNNFQPISATGLGLSLPPAEPGTGVTLIFNAPQLNMQGTGYPTTQFQMLQRRGRPGGSPTPIVFAKYQSPIEIAKYGILTVTLVRTIPFQDPEGSTFYVEWRAIGGEAYLIGDPPSYPSATLTAIVGTLNARQSADSSPKT